MIIVSFLCAFALYSFAKALVIDCGHQTNSWTNHGAIEECIVYGISVKTPQQPITSVKLKIIDWFSRNIEKEDETSVAEENVEDRDKIMSFYIRSSPSCYYVPSGIAENFKNVKVLVIAYTGLKAITQADLRPLKKLQNLYIDNNRLTSLDSDLFEHNPNIEYMNLASNQILTIGSSTFEPLKSLQALDFADNICYSKNAKGLENVELLKLDLKANCVPTNENLI